MRRNSQYLIGFALFCLLSVTAYAQSVCQISGTLLRIDGVTPAAYGQLEIIQTVKVGATISTKKLPVRADANGLLSFSARRSSSITLKGDFYGYTRGVTVNVPNASTASLEDLVILSTVFTTRGDLVYAETNGVPTRLPAGANGKVLKMVSGIPAWATESGGGGGGSLTVAEADAAPSVGSVATLSFNQAAGFTVTDQGGDEARVSLSGVPYSALMLTGAILNADLAGSIADSKLSTISTAGKVNTSALTGTLADGLFPATLPALNGSLLTNLNASSLATGTVDAARLPDLSGTYQPLNTNLTTISGLTPTDDDILQRKAGAWTNRTVAQYKTDLALNLVENTALSTWGGSSNITTVGTIGTGVWNGTAIAYNKLNLTGAILNGDLAGSITEGKFSLSDVTTGNATASAHGFLPKLSGNASDVFKGDGTFGAGGSVSGANPTASVGLSAVNGVATTYLRSDGAPALDQGIAPTWTGLHAFTPTVTTGNGLAVTGTPTSGNLVSIAASGTGAASNTKTALNVATSGANGTSTQTTYGGFFTNTSTGTSSTNVAIQATASGGTNNFAIRATGQIVGQTGFTVPAFTFADNTAAGFIYSSMTQYQASASVYPIGFSTDGLRVSSLASVLFGSGVVSGSIDLGLERSQAATLRIRGSSTTTAATFSTPALSPAQITADTNNYAPGTGWFIRLSSDASRNLTGLVAGVDGQVFEIWNVGTNNIVLQDESSTTASTAANRFLTSTAADLTVAPKGCARGRYDTTSARWRVALCQGVDFFGWLFLLWLLPTIINKARGRRFGRI